MTRVSPNDVTNERQPLVFLPRYMLTGKVDLLLFLALHAKHVRLRGLVLELRHKSIGSRHDTMERVMSVQSELSKWVNDVHERTEDWIDFKAPNAERVASPIPIHHSEHCCRLVMQPRICHHTEQASSLIRNEDRGFASCSPSLYKRLQGYIRHCRWC